MRRRERLQDQESLDSVHTMILLTGATGTIGIRMARALQGRGHAVRALVLPGDPFAQRLAGTGAAIVYGDITDPASLASVFDGIDTVYHLAAVVLSQDPSVFARVNVQGTKNMLSGAERAGVRHFIYCSSASVLYQRPTPYSLSKRKCEALVLGQDAMAHSIVRPTLVYGRGGGVELMMFWDYLRSHAPVIPFIGDGTARKRPVHVDDLIDGLLAIAHNPTTHGKTYNLSGGETLTIQELAERLLALEGKSARFLHIPTPVCEVVAKTLGRMVRSPPLTWNMIAGVTQDANLDPALAMRDLGYTPASIQEGLRRVSRGG